MTLSASDFELLLQANRILSSKLDDKEVLTAVLELATKVVKAEASSLLLLDAANNELYFDVALGSVQEKIKQIRLKVGEGIAGWVAKERLPLIVNDVTKDSRFSGKGDESTQFKTRSILAVPMLAKGQLIGVVEAINKENRGLFTEQDQEAFEIFGSQSAIAIENARLFSDVMREKEKLNTVFAEMSDGVLLLDESGKILLCNESASGFLGLTAQEAIGKVFGPAVFPEFESNPPFSGVSSIHSKLTQIDLVRRAGKDFYVSALVLNLKTGKSRSNEGYLVILHDDTETKREERLKRNFLSLISHKLKTPLTVIVGYAPVLSASSDGLNEMQKKAIKSISDQGQHLSRLVDKLLRFTIVESDTLTREQKELQMNDVIQAAVNATDVEGIEVKIDVDKSIAKLPAIVGDVNLTVELFKNVIENAVKFNDKPKRNVTISGKKSKGNIEVEISDDGVGIPAEEIEKVFQKFYQVENSFTGQVPGAGLGLSLCKKVVDVMGGSIEIKSKIGKGTSVFITLPVSGS